MSRLELTTRAYWAAAKALNRPLSVEDRITHEDTLAMIAARAGGRVGEVAARRLETGGVMAGLGPQPDDDGEIA